MQSKRMLLNVVIFVLVVCMAGVSYAVPMGTAFVYQGYLIDAGSAADGLYDFEFALYNDDDAGSQQGSTITENDLDVIDGTFGVELDFGSGIFTGDARWLEIAVRPGESGDPCDFVTLSPRQELTPTPYAINADKVDSYDYSSNWPTTLGNIQSACSDDFHTIGGLDDDAPDSDGEVPDNISVNNGRLYAPSGSGNVGIGTTSPGTNKLKVVGNIDATGFTEGGSNTLSNDISGNAATATNADMLDYYHASDFIEIGYTNYSDGYTLIDGTRSNGPLLGACNNSTSIGSKGLYGYGYYGVYGSGNNGVWGKSSSDSSEGGLGVGLYGVYGRALISGAKAGYFDGDVYVTDNVSALSFTDRTPYPRDLETAYEAVMSMECLPDGQYQENNREVQLDHSKLSDFVRSDDGNRDLSATVSAHNEVLKDLIKKVQRQAQIIEMQNMQIQQFTEILQETKQQLQFAGAKEGQQ